MRDINTMLYFEKFLADCRRGSHIPWGLNMSRLQTLVVAAGLPAWACKALLTSSVS